MGWFKKSKRLALEDQLEALADLGIQLNPGITIDDMLYSYPRKEYERVSFDVVFFVLGIEVERKPWGRFFSNQVWNFDTECIEDPAIYTEIVQNLCRISNAGSRVTEIESDVDFEADKAWLKYRVVRGEESLSRHWEIEISHDWADSMTISYVMADIEQGGHHFYAKANGQASILFYLHQDTADKLNQLSSNTLARVLA